MEMFATCRRDIHTHVRVMKPWQVPQGQIINEKYLLEALSYDDLWEDAKMPQVIKYLYGSRHQVSRFPPELKSLIEQGLDDTA